MSGRLAIGSDFAGFSLKEAINSHLLSRGYKIDDLGMTDEEKERLIEAEWQKQDDNAEAMYVTDIKIYAMDRRNIVFDISKVFTEMLINVTSMTLRTNRQGKATINVAFEIKSVEQLHKVIAKIRNIDDIIDIERTMG